MSFDGRIDGDRPSFIDRFNSTLAGLGSGDTNIGEVVDQNKFKNIALFATNILFIIPVVIVPFSFGYFSGI